MFWSKNKKNRYTIVPQHSPVRRYSLYGHVILMHKLAGHSSYNGQLRDLNISSLSKYLIVNLFSPPRCLEWGFILIAPFPDHCLLVPFYMFKNGVFPFGHCQKRTSIYKRIEMSRPMGKPTICIGENKDADQLRGNREADQRHCFRCSDCTLTLLLKSEISSFQLFSVLVQASLCRTCSETTLLVFPRGDSNDHVIINYIIVDVTILLSLLSNAFISISLNNDDICCRNLHVTLVC